MNRIDSVDTAASAMVKTAATATPAATGVAVWLSNKDINFWVGAAGIAFIALQAAHLTWKWYVEYSDRQAKKKGRR